MKNLERKDINMIAKKIMVEVATTTQDLDEIKMIIGKVEDLIVEDVPFSEITNLIEFIKSVKNNGNVSIKTVIDLYIDRIIKVKDANIESSVKEAVVKDQAKKIASLTGLDLKEIEKTTSIEGKILDLMLPSKELNFKSILGESLDQGVKILERKAQKPYHGDENR